MAIGDNAYTRGMSLTPGTLPANQIDTAINQALDYIDFYTRWANLANKPTSFANADVTAATPSGDQEANFGKIARFNGTGQIGFSAPTAGQHAATKSYVDSAVSGVSTDVTNATPLATANTIAKRDSNGRISAANPAAGSHVATKAYVDNIDTTLQSIATDALNTAEAAESTLVPLVGAVEEVKDGQLNSYVYGHEITSTRRSVWIQSNGDLGYASSSRHKKQNIRPADLTLEQLRGIPVVLYRYRKAVAAERAGKIDHAPTEIGTIAEDLDALGLWQFVFYEDGKPAGVHYELLALAAVSLGQQLADRFDQLEARVAALEVG